MAEISVKVENLVKTYQKGEIKALKGVSFNVNKGELFGIIGPDGAGKTTLLRILTSLLIQDSGIATLEGYDCVKDYKAIRNIIGYMPGRFSLYQDLSVEENLKFFATVFGTTLKENYDLIKDIYVQIEPFKTRPAGKLSGGMKQKLALCCALIHKPVVLILDEPTTGVDAVSRKEFWEMLQNLKEKGITILVSTPYMDEATLCDRVALIQKGDILEINTPQKIIDKFDRELLSISSDNMYQLINDLRNYKNTHSIYPFGQELHYTDKQTKSSQNEIREYLTTKGNKNVLVNNIQPNIEDCFMALMTKEDNGSVKNQ
jgi:ABC-2 type transport system ATP-binding protein